MIKVYLSRAINCYIFNGSADEMFSSRVHRECWKCEKIIDMIFFWQKQHCKTTYRWEYNMTKRSELDKMDGLQGVQLFEWEFDHQPLEEENEISKCEECGKPFAEEEAVVVKKYDGGSGFTVTFCSEACASQFYINKLREVDGS